MQIRSNIEGGAGWKVMNKSEEAGQIGSDRQNRLSHAHAETRAKNEHIRE